METVPGIPTKVMELIGQLQNEKNKYNLAAIISELEDIGAMAEHAIPHLHSIAQQWKGFHLAELANKAAKQLYQAALKEKEAKQLYYTKSMTQRENVSLVPPSKRDNHEVVQGKVVRFLKFLKRDVRGLFQKKETRNIHAQRSFHEAIQEVHSRIGNLLKSVFRGDIWEKALNIKNKPEEVPSNIWMIIKPWIAPNNMWKLLVTLSIIIPLLAFVFPLSFNIPYWVLWVLIFYGSIYSFGYFNRNYCDFKSPFQGTRVPKGRYLNRPFFLSWLLLEAILFIFVIWFRLVSNLTVILILFFGIFGIFGLVYGLADVTCPHCGAINGGVKNGEIENIINYRCCVCKKTFSHGSGMN